MSRYFQILGRSLRLRCPRCGREKLFASWFKMREKCSHCQLKYEREPGFFLGSIYFNYGLTALVVAITYPILLFNKLVGENVLMAGSMTFVLLFPLYFFRYSRALWLGFDQFVDPRGKQESNDTDGEPKP